MSESNSQGLVVQSLMLMQLLPQAYHAFTDDQRRQLRRHLAALHHAPINTLEFIGGALLPFACFWCSCVLLYVCPRA